MATVALLVNPGREDARALSTEAARWLAAAGHRARVLSLGEGDRVVEDGGEGDLTGVDLTGADLAVSLGGDGTFLRLVSLAWMADVPVLGVNFGRVGYLLDLQPRDFLRALARTLAGDVVLEERTALTVTLGGSPSPGPDRPDHQGPTERAWFALNEVVLEKTVFGHTVRLEAAIDGDPFLTYSADGLLVSTPTGSTAYNLSAGGPVLSPRLAAMVVTPVAPHLSLDRSLVLHPDQAVTVTVLDERPAVLVVDGQEAGRLFPGSSVTCRIASSPVRVVSLGERGLGGLLRITLALDRDR